MDEETPLDRFKKGIHFSYPFRQRKQWLSQDEFMNEHLHNFTDDESDILSEVLREKWWENTAQKVKIFLMTKAKIPASDLQVLSWVDIIELLKAFQNKTNHNQIKLSPADQEIKKEIDRLPGQMAISIANKTGHHEGSVRRTFSKLEKLGYYHVDNGDERGYYPPKNPKA